MAALHSVQGLAVDFAAAPEVVGPELAAADPVIDPVLGVAALALVAKLEFDPSSAAEVEQDSVKIVDPSAGRSVAQQGWH